jgi:hypothetical protein
MKFRIDSNYIFGALGAAGAGAPVLWPEQRWIGAFLLVAAGVVFVLGVRIEGLTLRSGRPHLGALKLNIYVATMIASALVFAAASVAYFMDRAQGPILWAWGPNSPLGTSMSSGGPLWIDGYNIGGENRSGEVIVPKSAYVRSGLNGQIIPLKFSGGNGPVELDKAVVPGHRKFFLGATLPSRDERHSNGISAEAFRADFPSFTFVFEQEGAPSFSKRFDEKAVEALVAVAEKANRDALRRASEQMPGSGIVERPKGMEMSSPDNGHESGAGGKGGSARVGGHGIAIGGSGGQAGKYGKGGDGGSGEVVGDGLAAGGAGGAAGDDGLWRAPAKSGYEVAQRKLGLPVDPVMRQYGRGGAVLGYEPKLRVVEQLRAAFFAEHGLKPQSIFENIGAVPLTYLNASIASRGENWRVRIADDEYEFFLPRR